VVLVFAVVYLAMVLGHLPGLAIDRTGAALLGAIALVAARRISPHDAWVAIDVPTMALLLGLMVVSAQLRLGGFYSEVARRVAAAPVGPARLLAGVIALAGALSAVLANDVVCLAVTPVLAVGCLRRGLRPEPYLLALACAANVGSAATLIGNPQNMLIGQRLGLSFSGYLADALPPAVLGCAVTWAIIALLYRGRWHCPPVELEAEPTGFNRWQSGKGLAVVAVVVMVFLLAPVPREVVAPVVPCPQPYSYRNRIMVRSQWNKPEQKLNLGFVRGDCGLVEDVLTCAIAEPCWSSSARRPSRSL